MTRSRPTTFLGGAAAVALSAVALAACGGGGGGNAATSSAPRKTASGHAATLGVADTASLGKILVDSRGSTLYLFKKDTGGKSACTGACATAWPPLRASGKPAAGSGRNASQVATIKRSVGKPQVTYNGHPLYRYRGDQNPGAVNGQGLTEFGARWLTLSPAGNQVSGTGPNSGGVSGY
jgi:predicted lipoprotein with Yx(FWY)xxD motif